MNADVVITGIGLITPLGDMLVEAWDAMAAGTSAVVHPGAFSTRGFGCPLCAPIGGAAVETLIPDSKLTRFMNRDAMLAVIAARRAVRDAGLEIGRDYEPEEAGLFGATGLAGVALEEVSRMVSNAADAGGRFDLRRFGSVALRQVRPVLSFKILSNMPVCFVSISEQFRGINDVYTPWEGQGGQAIASGVRAIQHGDAACVLVGGCDVKAHALGFIALHQQGVFSSWEKTGRGTIPGEGSCFLVLEEFARALKRGARIYARMAGQALGTVRDREGRSAALASVLNRLGPGSYSGIIAAGDGDESLAEGEQAALATTGAAGCIARIYPKKHMGNLFAAAAAIQVAFAAVLARKEPRGGRVLANCFGYGSQQAAFVLEGVP